MKKLKSIQPAHQVTPAQLACLASAAQRDIVEVLAREGPLSRADIAARLERPAASTFYQLKRLISAGLVLVDGGRPSGRRPHLVYRLVSDRLHAGEAAASQDGRSALAKAGRRIAHAAGRAFAAAVEAGAAVEGTERQAAVRRLVLRLDAEGLAQFNALADEFIERARGLMRAEGQDVGVTFVLAPHRAGRPVGKS